MSRPETQNNPHSQAIKTLMDVFGVQFSMGLHRPNNDFRCAHHDKCLKSCGCADGIFVEPSGDQLWKVTLRGMSTADGRVDAAANVTSVDRDSVVRLARVAMDLLEKDQTISGLNDELGYFIEQVSGDLEEACWFRKMAEQVAACRPDEPMELLCKSVLPQLRSLLFARSLVVLQDVAQNDDGVTLLGMDSENDGEWEQLGLRLLQQFRSQGFSQSIVQNAGFPLRGLQDSITPVRSFVLVRIGTVSQHFGWLIAMGRTDAVGTAGQSRRSESEFGTHEATLMETAAVLLATHAANCDLFAEQERTLVGVVTAMVNSLDARDPYTRGHSHRVALIGQRLAQQIGFNEEECENIYLTGLLHDIGKIGVPDDVLLKSGPLNAEERLQIEQHTVIGHSILKPVRQLEKVLPGVLHHHEKIDGSGYPEQLKGQEIPIAGRILAVADAFDAMTTCRPYRNAMPVAQAVQILLEGTGTHWDEVVVDAFFSSLADIHRIYELYETAKGSERESLIQYGRFEDVSHNRLNDLANLNMTGN